MYHVVPMSEAYAREIACWQYPGAYAIYSLQPSEELLAELLDGSYYACLDEKGALAGYFCFGQSARCISRTAWTLALGWSPGAAAKGREPPSCRRALRLPLRPSLLSSCGWWWPPLTGGRFTCIKSLALSARHRSPTCAPASRLS